MAKKIKKSEDINDVQYVLTRIDRIRKNLDSIEKYFINQETELEMIRSGKMSKNKK